MIEERVPKYFQLKKAIIRKIEEEEYLPGGLIPSERELMEQYQVSRITVRKAIDELVVEGYLYKIQGKGTYVKTDEKGND
ncbi:MAG TPA: GntR family transcriptional regulator, partial [Clostridiales bacterium]|nr:GntR family transcriptional regulator [Clostridiales bacterium]